MRLKTVAAIAALQVCATASVAQAQVAQTSDGALRFLGQSMNNAKVRWPNSDQFAWVVGTHISLGEHKPSSCKTGLTFEDRNAAGQIIGKREIDIAWAAVVEVKQQGERVVMKLRDPQTIYFDMAAEGLAARVAFAMEFMRQYCDPTADTGF